MPCTTFGDPLRTAFGPIVHIFVGIILTFALGFTSYRRRSLSLSGAIATFTVGSIIFFTTGLYGWTVLIVFFFTCVGIGRLARRVSRNVADGLQKKGGCRDYMQVIANGGPATVCSFLYFLTGSPIWLRAYGAAMAESNSDTWAGEVGLFSKTPPVLITRPWCSVEPGLSGGVTALGTSACFAGALLIGLTAGILFRSASTNLFREIVIITITGFAGGLWDSVLGATVQAHYWDTVRNRITEHESRDGVRFQLHRGWAWVDNDIVNLSSNLFAVALAVLL
jgi:uncharacterized protein (TIGR00297 family)